MHPPLPSLYERSRLDKEEKFVKITAAAIMLGRHFLNKGVFVSFRLGPKADFFADWDSEDYDAVMYAMRTVRYSRQTDKENTSE